MIPLSKCRSALVVLAPVVLALSAGGSLGRDDLPATAGAAAFDPASAFCERQTFQLESTTEVAPWLAYAGGLRTGRSTAPADGCPSATVRAIIGVVASESEELAKARRTGFHMAYVARAMEKDLADRAIDADGSFRYRNDVTLASFIWLLCPGTGAAQRDCTVETIEALPDGFLATSPVFCDFASTRSGAVEWPPAITELPLLCSKGAADPGSWVRRSDSLFRP